MSKAYCGACRGERGCTDCNAVTGTVEYTGLTDFFGEDDSWNVSGLYTEKNHWEGFAYTEELVLAADLGTTTLAFVCADANGVVLASYGTENPQRKVAADVIGRIDAALHGQKECLADEIKEALIKGFLFVLDKAKKRLQTNNILQEGKKIRIAIAGNTTMQHLLLGYPVTGLAKAPFAPYSREGITISFKKLFGKTKGYETAFLDIRKAEVTVFPCLSAFVGGDAVAGAYAVFPGVWEAEKKEREAVSLLVDLGTNGELLLYRNGDVYGTAAAMGSAFEGGRFAYSSDLFRLIAQARREHILDDTGLLNEPYFTNDYQGLEQDDVRAFQLAKGALRAGIELLCRRTRVSLSEVEHIFVAGGIGSFCREDDLFETDLLPKEWRGRVKFVGNSCIGGLLLYLKSKESVLYCKGTILNLAEEPEFESLYYHFMNFETKE